MFAFLGDKALIEKSPPRNVFATGKQLPRTPAKVNHTLKANTKTRVSPILDVFEPKGTPNPQQGDENVTVGIESPNEATPVKTNSTDIETIQHQHGTPADLYPGDVSSPVQQVAVNIFSNQHLSTIHNNVNPVDMIPSGFSCGFQLPRTPHGKKDGRLNSLLTSTDLNTQKIQVVSTQKSPLKVVRRMNSFDDDKRPETMSSQNDIPLRDTEKKNTRPPKVQQESHVQITTKEQDDHSSSTKETDHRNTRVSKTSKLQSQQNIDASPDHLSQVSQKEAIFEEIVPNLPTLTECKIDKCIEDNTSKKSIKDKISISKKETKINKIEKDSDCIQTHNVSNNIYTSRNNQPNNDISRRKNTGSARRDVADYQEESRNTAMSKNKSQLSSIETVSPKRSNRRTKTINTMCDKDSNQIYKIENENRENTKNYIVENGLDCGQTPIVGTKAYTNINNQGNDEVSKLNNDRAATTDTVANQDESTNIMTRHNIINSPFKEAITIEPLDRGTKKVKTICDEDSNHINKLREKIVQKDNISGTEIIVCDKNETDTCKEKPKQTKRKTTRRKICVPRKGTKSNSVNSKACDSTTPLPHNDNQIEMPSKQDVEANHASKKKFTLKRSKKEIKSKTDCDKKTITKEIENSQEGTERGSIKEDDKLDPSLKSIANNDIGTLQIKCVAKNKKSETKKSSTKLNKNDNESSCGGVNNLPTANAHHSQVKLDFSEVPASLPDVSNDADTTLRRSNRIKKMTRDEKVNDDNSSSLCESNQILKQKRPYKIQKDRMNDISEENCENIPINPEKTILGIPKYRNKELRDEMFKTPHAFKVTGNCREEPKRNVKTSRQSKKDTTISTNKNANPTASHVQITNLALGKVEDGIYITPIAKNKKHKKVSRL